MRKTVTLDPDVEALVKRRTPVSFPTYAMGIPRIPGDKVLQLAAELEDEEIVRGMGLGT